MPGQERLGDGLLFGALALGRRSEDVHVVATQHGRRVGILSSRVGVDLGVEHDHLHVGTILQDHLRRVLIADVAHATVAADRPHLGQLKDFVIGHERVAEMRELVVLARRDHISFAASSAFGKPLRDDGATARGRR